MISKRKPTGKAGKVLTAQAQVRQAEPQDWLNRRVYHPLAYRIAKWLARTSVTPDMVSVAGGLVVVIAGVVYSSAATPLAALGGLALHMSWHVLDGADGDLARMTDRASHRGEMIDGIVDYVSHIVLYLILASMLADRIGPSGWALMVASGIARAVQTNFFETLRRRYQYWVHARPWLGSASALPVLNAGRMGSLARAYLTLSAGFNTGAQRIDRIVAEASEDRREQRIAPVLREEMIRLLRATQILSSNYRTLLIGLAVAAEWLMVIVLVELVALSVAMILFAAWSRRALGRAMERIG